MNTRHSQKRRKTESDLSNDSKVASDPKYEGTLKKLSETQKHKTENFLENQVLRKELKELKGKIHVLELPLVMHFYDKFII